MAGDKSKLGILSGFQYAEDRLYLFETYIYLQTRTIL